MEDIPEIINTPIVTEFWDQFWQLPQLKDPSPKQVLIFSLPFEPNSADQIQLTKMIQACKLELTDCYIHQMKEDELCSWHQIRTLIQPKYVLVLGINPQQLGISALFMPHQVSRFNECSWIFTDGLSELAQRPEIKTHLWNYGLKPVFVEKIYG